MKKRIFSVLMIAILLLGILAGCGEESETTQQSQNSAAEKTETSQTEILPTKYAYKADYIPLTTHEGEKISYSNSFSVGGDYVYYSGSYVVGMVQATDPVTGVVLTDAETGEPIEYEEMKDGLFRMDLKTGEVTLLEGYTEREIPEGWEGYNGIGTIAAAADGSVWVQQQGSTYRYNIPEDFNAASDEYYNYFEEGDQWNELCRYSPEGELLQTIDLTFDEEFYFGQMMFHDDGLIFLSDYEKIYVLDGTGAQVACLTDDRGWVEMQQIAGDRIGISVHDNKVISFPNI